MHLSAGRILVTIFVVTATLAAAESARAISFTTLDNPLGVKGSSIYGISGSTLVGSYIDAQNLEHGYVYDGTTFTTLDDPLGVKGTTLLKTAGGVIVGLYADAASNTHGLIYNGQTFTTVDNPLGVHLHSTYSVLAGTDGVRSVGFYRDNLGNEHGFVYNGSTFTPIQESGASDSYAFGIDGSTIVGATITQGYPGQTGFIFDGSSFTTKLSTQAIPGFGYTDATGVDGGRVVGWASVGPPARIGGFMYENGVLTLFDDPLAVKNNSGSGTFPWDVEGNIIVGHYFDAAGVSHGFIATVPEPSSISLCILGAVGCGLLLRAGRKASA